MQLLFLILLLAALSSCVTAQNAGNTRVECKGKFSLTLQGMAGGSVTGDCGDGAYFQQSTVTQ